MNYNIINWITCMHIASCKIHLFSLFNCNSLVSNYWLLHDETTRQLSVNVLAITTPNDASLINLIDRLDNGNQMTTVSDNFGLIVRAFFTLAGVTYMICPMSMFHLYNTNKRSWWKMLVNYNESIKTIAVSSLKQKQDHFVWH